MLKAILFDVDGTLLDTTEFIYQSFEYSMRSHKLRSVPREELQLMIGKSLEDCYREYTQLDDVMELMESHRAFQRANIDLSKPYPNTLHTLEKLRTKGLSIAAVTSRSRDSAIETLEVAELFPLIDYVVGFEDVVLPKPDPEAVNKVLNFFSFRPEEAMMVGDSDVDVAAGKNAGTMTVGVSYGFHGDRIVEAEPDHVIDDIGDILNIVET